ncbi:MAG TPA: VIT domain-containing protein [Candidatus Obscuribacterales bacterium]
MKRVALASMLSLAASLMVAPASRASGFIVIDTMGAPVTITRPPVVRPTVPGHRPVPVPTPGGRPILHGNVSYGLHLQSESIKVDVNNQVAKTYISQTFKNDTDRNLAGTYLFPLPDDTTFSSFSLHMDGKPVEGKILEATEARQQYEAIVRRMVDPGLLEYADYKTVRARIFPIPAHGTKKVELEYTQILKAENGLLKYRFPLKAKGGDEPVDEVKIDLKLASNQGLRTIWSPTHIVSTNKTSDNLAKVAFAGKDFVPDKDFLLYYSVSDKALAANVLTHKSEGDDGYFLLTLAPPVKSTQVSGKDIVLIADTSGSMQGEKMVQAKQALKYIVNALHADDRFSIVEFNTDAEALKTQLLQATPENKKAAVAFIDDLEARGGTNIGDALRMGSTMLNQVSDRPAYLVLMTDGQPTVGETDVNQLLKTVRSKRDIRVFDFGVGYEVNTKLLNRLADEHHGTSEYVEPGENLETALSGFYQKIKSPVLSNVSIAYEGVQVKDIYPRAVKDIFAGSQVLLMGKYKGGGQAKVTLTGKVNGVAKAYSFPLNFAASEADHTYLPRLWAMRRIGYLTDVAQDNGNNREVVDEIIALSKKYGIISAYTSFLVTDPSEAQAVAVRPVASPSPVAAWAPGGGGARRGFGGRPIPRAIPQSWGGDEFTLSTEEKSAIAPRLSGATNGTVGPQGADAFLVGGGKGFFSSLFSNKAEAGKERERDDFAKQIAMAPSSGHRAVHREQVLAKLKHSEALGSKDNAAQGIKAVEDKTFYFRDGFWTDSAYVIGHAPAPKLIEFGTSQYFELVRSQPGLARYLSVGANVIIMFKGQCYKIVAPAKTTG